jgi:prolyl-tRNA synthetase
MCGRCGLESSVIETGLMIYSAAGEGLAARCDQCGYAADLDFARPKANDPPPDPEGSLAKEEFFTPGSKTIAAIAGFTGLPETSQMKSLVMLADAAAAHRSTTFSGLGCIAAVMAIVSPSQPSPAMIQSMSISVTRGPMRLIIVSAGDSRVSVLTTRKD